MTTPAQAHVEVEMITPSENERLVRAPADVRLSFSGPVESDEVHVELVGVRTRTRADLQVAGDGLTQNPEIDLPASLPDDSYRLEVRALATDGHTVVRDFAFVVGDGPLVGASGAGTGLSSASPAVNALDYATTVLRLVGLVLVGAAVAGTAARAAFPPWLERAWLAGPPIGLVAAASDFLLAWPRAGGTGLSEAFSPAGMQSTLGSQIGSLTVVRALALVALWVVVAQLVRRRRAEPYSQPLGWENALYALSVAVLLGVVGASHAASDEWAFVTLVVGMIHVGAVCLWLGAVVDVGAFASRRLPWREAAAASRPVATVAQAGVVVVVASGPVITWRVAGNLAGAYGVLLAVKLVLVGLMLGMGLRGGLLLRRAPTDASISRGQVQACLRLEVGAGLVVLAVAGAMAHASPG